MSVQVVFSHEEINRLLDRAEAAEAEVRRLKLALTRIVEGYRDGESVPDAKAAVMWATAKVALHG